MCDWNHSSAGGAVGLASGDGIEPIVGADFLDETNLRKLSRILTAALRLNASV